MHESCVCWEFGVQNRFWRDSVVSKPSCAMARDGNEDCTAFRRRGCVVAMGMCWRERQGSNQFGEPWTESPYCLPCPNVRKLTATTTTSTTISTTSPPPPFRDTKSKTIQAPEIRARLFLQHPITSHLFANVFGSPAAGRPLIPRQLYRP